jgi:trigger factor
MSGAGTILPTNAVIESVFSATVSEGGSAGNEGKVAIVSWPMPIGNRTLQDAIYGADGSKGSTAMAHRPEIPEPMNREVRQRCGFGCVICGLPLYEYEHLEGWAKVQRHAAGEITLLCDRHHREKTAGLLPLAVVREADQNPHNRQAGVSRPYDLHYAGNSCELIVGGNDFTRDGLAEGTTLIAVAIDRVPLLAFTFEQDHLFLTLQVFDEQGQRVLWVERNELRYCPIPWDIRLEGRTLTVREGRAKFLLEVLFSPPDRVEVRRGRFSLNGLELLIHPDQVCYANGRNTVSRFGTRGFDVAVMVGEPLETGARALHWPAVNRGQPNREAAQQWMQEIAQM